MRGEDVTANGDHKGTKDTKNDRANELSHIIIGAAIEVHRVVGPGLLESAYEECLAHELRQSGIGVQRQLDVPLEYKGLVLGCAYRLDLLIEGLVVVEVKSVERLTAIHTAQVLTYLRTVCGWVFSSTSTFPC